MEERRKKIVDLVDAEGQITFAQLKSAFPNVSEMTLRTDLKHLNESGRIVRVHGGARSAEIVAGAEDFFSKRVQRNREQKQAIAKKAIIVRSSKSSVGRQRNASWSVTMWWRTAQRRDLAFRCFSSRPASSIRRGKTSRPFPTAALMSLPHILAN